MAWISAYGCTTAAGNHKENLWQGLHAGQDFSRPHPEIPNLRFYQFSESPKTQREALLHGLLASWKQMEMPRNSSKLGVILASTKGFIDDVIWSKESLPPVADTISPLLEDFLKASELNPVKATCVSNACASGLSALYLAQVWLKSSVVDEVLVLGADAVGLFVLKGFQSLRVITGDRTRPFSEGRSGFYLGQATAAVLLTSQKQDLNFKLGGVGIDAEGFAVTRPSQTGDSLKRAVVKALKDQKPDLILAHGTATPVNDATEDQVFYDLFVSKGHRPQITGSKWAIGHTLGVCGLLDVMMGCEVLKSQKIFNLANTTVKDQKFHCDYRLSGTAENTEKISNFMVTSLGFGGIHAAALIQKGHS